MISHTLARPYAKAIFQLAKASGNYQEWATLLHLLAIIMANKQVVNLIKNPIISVEDKARFVIDVGENRFNSQAKDFISLLSKYDRLLVSTEIHALYEQYKAAEEQIIAVEIYTAMVFNSKEQEQIRVAVSKYFQKTIVCAWKQDPSLIGGFIAKAEDEIFDGSIRGQLQALRRELVSS
jgi:F-type H+-transporting ATPase subunit delta